MGCIAAHQVPLSMGFPKQKQTNKQTKKKTKNKKQKNWNGLPFPSPEDFSNPGIKPMSPVSPALAGEFFTTELLGKPLTRFPLHYERRS